jgi:hypothetical protein
LEKLVATNLKLKAAVKEQVIAWSLMFGSTDK